MATYEIPLTPIAQKIPITLGGVSLILKLAWRNAGGSGWVLDIADGNGNAMVSGLPLVTGADLLGQHKHLGIPAEMWVQTDGDPDAVPTYDNLGTNAHLLVVEP